MLHDKEFIVSLTSWKNRINIVHNAIESIMNQTVKPDKIVLNLSLDEFPSGNDELPDNLISLIDKCMEIFIDIRLKFIHSNHQPNIALLN